MSEKEIKKEDIKDDDSLKSFAMGAIAGVTIGTAMAVKKIADENPEVKEALKKSAQKAGSFIGEQLKNGAKQVVTNMVSEGVNSLTSVLQQKLSKTTKTQSKVRKNQKSKKT